jgi:hypothetical protein
MILLRTFILVLYCLCSTITSYAQDPVPQLPRHAIKFSPLHILNPEVNSIQLSYEYRFLPELSLQVEGGYVLEGVWWTAPEADAEGYKLKEEIRWYFENKEIIKRTGKSAYNGVYVAMELHQNRITFSRNGEEKLYRQNGIGIKTGIITFSTWRFVFDLNAGLSFTRTNMEPLGIPLNNAEPGPGGYKVVLPILGVRLGMWIR